MAPPDEGAPVDGDVSPPQTAAPAEDTEVKSPAGEEATPVATPPSEENAGADAANAAESAPAALEDVPVPPADTGAPDAATTEAGVADTTESAPAESKTDSSEASEPSPGTNANLDSAPAVDSETPGGDEFSSIAATPAAPEGGETTPLAADVPKGAENAAAVVQEVSAATDGVESTENVAVEGEDAASTNEGDGGENGEVAPTEKQPDLDDYVPQTGPLPEDKVLRTKAMSKVARKRRQTSFSKAPITRKTTKADEAKAMKNMAEDLTPVQRFILSSVATLIDAEDDAVFNCMARPDVMQAMDSILPADSATRCLLFLMSKDADGKVTGELVVQGKTSGSGTLIYCVRTTKKALTSANASGELNFGNIPVDGTNSAVLKAIVALLTDAIAPMVLANQKWGKMLPGDASQDAFFHTLNSTVDTMKAAAESVDVMVVLPVTEKGGSKLAQIQGPKEYMAFAQKPDTVAALEPMLNDWNRRIKDVVIASEQIRSESDSVGPRAEIAHWKHRMATFNGLLDQMKSSKCVTTVNVLKLAKSKAADAWHELDTRTTEEANMAKDNVKFLHTLDELCSPLYQHDLQKMENALPELVRNVAMIHSVSRFYNTSGHMSALFVKITNQMITSSREYVYRSEPRLWEQDPDTLLTSLAQVQKLHHAYHDCFNREKARLAKNPEGRQFDFSVMSIFGKSILFAERIAKIENMLRIVKDWQKLEHCKIDGVANFNSNFRMQLKQIKSKAYDPLDIRKQGFESDYEMFTVNMADLGRKLQDFCDSFFRTVTASYTALRFLERFERLKFLGLKLDAHYKKVLLAFGAELEDVRKTYQAERNAPTIARGTPPMAGAILWSRQLFQRIERTMSKLQVMKPDVLNGGDAKKIIKNYNKLGQTLMLFEDAYYDGWLKAVGQANSLLCVTLLVLGGDSKLKVNWDPTVLQLIHETKFMEKLNKDVPESAQKLVAIESQLKSHKMLLELLTSEYASLMDKIPDELATVLKPMVHRMQERVLPGRSKLSWVSVNITDYLTTIRGAMQEFDVYLTTLLTILRARVDASITEIRDTTLCAFPEEHEAWTVEQFEYNNDERFAKMRKHIEALSAGAESATGDLIATLCRPLDTAVTDGEAFQGAIAELRAQLAGKLATALVVSTKSSLDALRRALSPRITFAESDAGKSTPLLTSTVELTVPAGSEDAVKRVVINPSLDQIQVAVTRVVGDVVAIAKSVVVWGQDRSKAHGALTNLLADVNKNKDILRQVDSMSSVVNQAKGQVLERLQMFEQYSDLWTGDREKAMKAFLEAEPDLGSFEEEVSKYESLEQEIGGLDDSVVAGPLLIVLSDAKKTLIKETSAWKSALGHALQQKSHKDIQAVFHFADDTAKRLGRKLTDLEDVRLVMETMKDYRENEIKFDRMMGPIEQGYKMLEKNNVKITKEEQELLDSLQYQWKNMNTAVSEVSTELVRVQPEFRDQLVGSVEQFGKDQHAFTSDYNIKGPMCAGIKPSEANDRLSMFQTRFDDLWKRYVTYSSGEQLFGLAQSEYTDLLRIKKELNLLSKLYSLYNDVIKGVSGFYDIKWVEVDVEVISGQLVDFGNRCRKLPKALKEWDAYLELQKRIDDFSETLPMLEAMANPAMLPRHWKRIEDLCNGYSFDVENEAFELRGIMEAPLLEHKEDIEDVCISAVKEQDIDVKLKAVVKEWSARILTFSEFKSRGELLVNGSLVTELVTVMEDSLMILGSLLSNRYNTPFKPEIQKWVRNLSDTSEILEKWLVVQNLWVYLEAVFVGGDIAKQLPKEAKRFGNIDKSWQKLMQRAHENNNLIQCCVGDETMANVLPHLLEQLEVCQKSLTGYLEKKRLVFPRFFFVSDPVLLEILGQASDSHTIQDHLPSLFDNVHHVTFNEKVYDEILAYHSQEGEVVQMNKPVKAQGNVEVWLGSLLNAQQKSLSEVIADASIAIRDENLQLVEYMNAYPSQVGIIGLQVLWTIEAEEALDLCRVDKKAMVAADEKFEYILSTLIAQTIEDVDKLTRRKYETLVTLHLHQRDIFHDDILLKKVKSKTDFEWSKQMRFYYDDESRKIKIYITDWLSKYCMEFIGCVERLCVTPLTDRCYITLAQALLMSMGGAPAGPAGTGKTETTKDMGRALGKYVVVFNCSDQMDFRGLGRIYKGLAQSGSWGCFDEFNRIELPVLSVAAQQIKIVLQAKLRRAKRFLFMDGDDVSLDPEFGLFLTMNPGYAGRQELPENLKIQFRTVAMMKPDRQIIIRVKLASCGFQNNNVLSRKFFTLYKLCEEQLTKQVHYDFGLRNILSVVRTLGAAKRANPEDSETKVVMRGLRDMNLSKMVDQDEPLFLSLISDLFPGIVLETAGYPELEAAIDSEIQKAQLINHAPWTLKLIQLFETQRVRHGFMVLGPSGAGKTENINCLTRAMTATGVPHREMRMNPKAITAPQMFGRLDVATNDWTDGIFSTLWRRSLKMKKGEKVWIVLDGPIDAVWIENLNSVLDDNKLLTLANGDRIPMSPDSKLVFEPHNVDNASPATVSRNGMVFMSSSALDWIPILEGWLLKRPAAQVDPIRECFMASYNAIQEYSRFSLNPKIVLLECNYIRQALDVLVGLIPEPTDGAPAVTPAMLQRLYIFSVMWSVGAVLELDDRTRLQEFMASHESKLDLPKLQQGETIFDYYVDEAGAWQHWRTKVEKFDYPTDPDMPVPSFTSILVPNVDNVRTDFLVDTIAKQRKAVLLIGESGTAKTVIVKGYAAKYDPEVQLFKTLNFSSTTTINGFQRNIEAYVDKRMGMTYGPPNGRKMTVFIDDINMPLINEWGDQIANEIVRQTMSNCGFYSLDKPGDFTTLADMQWIGAMPHPGGGRNDIPERLKRQFNIFNCTLPSIQSIETIFQTIGSGWFAEERGFPADVSSSVNSVVEVTRLIWQDTKVKMLPTPAKFHYVFNLRDMSRIFQGMLKIKAPECQDRATFFNLWKHEMQRVISDRFTSLKDVAWFNTKINQLVRDQLGESHEQLLDAEPFFVDFLRDAPEPTGEEGEEEEDLEAPKIYEQVPTMDKLTEKLHEYMELYNETVRGNKMDLVFFKDCIVHVVRVSRIIRTDCGNALLVGVGGSGKQSVTRLASAVAQYHVFQITLSRTYNESDLLADIKELYIKAGRLGQGVTFILTDNEIKKESFLEYVNNMLATGEIGGLIPRDEMDEILNDLIPVMKAQYPRRVPTNDELYAYFIERVRENLHVALCFSPVSEKFRQRATKFPAVFSGCTMDWFMSWPKDALIAVADHYLGKFDIACTPAVKQEVVNNMGIVQDGVGLACEEYFLQFRRQTYVTPSSYLSFLNSYRALYNQKKAAIDVLANQMETGLSKLSEAGESVAVLSKELAVKEVDLAKANKETEAVLVTVTAASAKAEKSKAEVQVIKDRAQGIVDAIDKDKVVAETKLAAAVPALEAAEKALLTIKPADIATVKKLGKPPHLIKRIMDVVLILFGRRLDPVVPDEERDNLCPVPTWSEALKTMNGPLLNELMSFNKDTISEEMVELCCVYTDMEDYSYERALKVCGNVAGLTSWTEAMVTFYWINKEVLPLKANLAVAEVKLGKATTELNAAQAILDEKQAELDAVQAKYDATMKRKKELQDDADTCERKMTAASTLIEGLGGEKVRWTAQSKMFNNQIKCLVGDVLTMCAFMSYCGPFNANYRTKLLQSWSTNLKTAGIPHSDNLDIVTELVDNVTASEWALQGLPVDPLSQQNGIITTKATRYPLMIDPQGQGKLWIKNKESANQLQVTNLNHKYFRNHLEDSLGNGRPLLIEDVSDQLDPCLDNVLAKNFIKSGSTFKVKVGDKECDVLNGFQLYITTKLANPAYTPEVFAATSIIDFTVTMKGLEDQLLARVIQYEKAELEEERIALATEVTSNQKKMKELEDNLLFKLVNTKGSLVDDVSLIEVLQTTKATAEDVNEKIRIANETTEKISVAREEYRPVAIRGSILYFLIVELSMVNPMYQTSLEQFLSVFNLTLKESKQSPVPAKRISNVIEHLTYATYCYTIRGLYTRDKFLLTILLALKVDMRDGNVKHGEFDVFIKGGASLDLNSVEPKPSSWILDTTWLNLVQLSSLPEFADITNQIARNSKAWKAWFDEAEPEEVTLPDGYESKLDVFKKLLLVRSWCPDRTVSQARKYIAGTLGQRYAESVIIDLDAVFVESTPWLPMICFLSLGADPTGSIMDLAKTKKLDCREISMGQGQEVHARKLVADFQENGGWVVLGNCHLALDFMAELQASVQDAEKPHEDFRLWITTEEHPQFPINMLQCGIKFTNEPPQGIKAGLKRTYAGVTQDQLDVSALPQWKPMMYGVAFLHSVVQERRKFGPLGWNIPYEFNAGDLMATTQMVQNAMDDMDPKKGVIWQAVRYHIGEVQYGGRVTDDRDKRLLNTFSDAWFGDFMFTPEFEFDKGYGIPKFTKLDECVSYIEKMPNVDKPGVFGLHTNADITCDTQVANSTLATILDIQPKDGGGGGESREDVVTRMCNDFLEKVPADFLAHEVQDRLKKMGAYTAMNIFLRQEIDLMQTVIAKVRRTLKDLLLAIDGTIIMSDSLRNALDSMFDARVPAAWEKISWMAATLGFWFTELVERHAQFYSWLFDGRPNCFWMTGFFNANGFTTAMRQEITRAHKGWALDTVVMANEVTKMAAREDVTGPPKEGIYVYGLFLDGAGWSKTNNALTEQSPKVLYVSLPVIHLFATNTTGGRDTRLYECPIYKKKRRTDLEFICMVDLKCGSTKKGPVHPNHWTLRGTALLCDTK